MKSSPTSKYVASSNELRENHSQKSKSTCFDSQSMNGLQELPEFSLELKDIFSETKVMHSEESTVAKEEPLSARVP